MDPTRFDDLIRSVTASPTRRGVVRALGGGALAGVFGLLTRGGGAAKKKHHKGNKGHKPKKPKGCKAGTHKCGNKCIPETDCCKNEECDCISNEFCQNGSCQCPDGAVHHNGRCGFLTDCKSFFLTCVSDHDCCSGSCSIFDGVQFRCDKSTTLCIADTDCVSGSCRGFVCPEVIEFNCPGT